MNEDEILFEKLDYSVQLGLNIKISRRFLLEPPLTQAEIAKYLGRSQHYISKVERGTANPTVEEVEKLAELFGVTVLELKPRFRRRYRY